MAQTWVENNENADGTTIKQGMINLENKALTLQTNWSGTTAPSPDVTQIGQFFWNTTEQKLYQLTTKTPSDTWAERQTTLPVPIAEGGTGATSGSAALTALGLSTPAKTLVAQTTQAAMRTTGLGVTTAMDSIITAATVAAARTGLGAGAAGDALFQTTTTSAARASLGLGLLATKNTVAQADIDTSSVDITRLKSSSTAGVLFGTNPGSTTPVEIPRTNLFRKYAGRPVTQLQNGCIQPNAVAVVTADGAVWTLGATASASPDYSGRTYNSAFRPLIFEGDPGTITKIVLSRLSGYALAGGKVWSWGSNTYGQLGHGDTTARKVAKKIASLDSKMITDIVSAPTGYGNTYDSIWLLTSDGEVYACGSNANGQLGDNTTTARSTPVQCGTINGITQLSISDCGSLAHVIALKSTGAIYTWGACGQGQLGQGNTTQLTTPTLVSGATGIDYVKALGSQSNGSTFIADSNTLKACGFNGNGGLGDGSTTQRNSFVSVSLPGTVGNIVEIAGSSGNGFTLVRDSFGSLFVSGRNNQGQLGQGNTVDRNTFINITVASGVTVTKIAVTNIDADGGTSVVLGSDGNLYATGNNSYGILGQTDTTNRSSFVKVLRPVDSDPIVDFRVVGSSTALQANASGILALTSSGQLLGCGSLSGSGLGHTMMLGDPWPREEHVLVPIPVAI